MILNEKNINNIIHDNSMEYSNYVIKNRALPDLRDGMKPVYRRILYTMHVMKATSFTKSQNITGQVMLFHPHGDCLSGDTKIKLLNGEVRTFKELERENKSHWVLSVNDNGEIVPALAHSFRKVKKVNKLKVIKFANGYEVKSTDDHKFRLINGDWIEAKDIRPGHILDYGIIDYKDYLHINGNKTKKVPIHCLVDHYFEGELKKGYIRHHLDENKHNNSPENLKRITLSSHMKTHNKDKTLSVNGANKSYHSLFDPNGEYYEENRKKNSDMFKQLNEKTALVRANSALKKLEELGMELTEENYESMRGKVYNLTKIDTLISKGFIKDFDDLVSQYKKGIKFINYEKKERISKGQNYNFKYKTNEHKDKCSKSFSYGGRIAALKKVANNSNFNFEKMKQSPAYTFVANSLPTIVETYYIEADEIVYDFSVEETHNALISVSEDDTLFAVAHNCYGTMVGMAQKDGNLTPLITGKGNFAQHTSRDLQAGAPRYTEAKLSEIAIDMMEDLDKNLVEFIPNFDGTRTLPEVLPVKFPAILHYAQEGIAVGMSSRIPSFNLIELNSAIMNYIETGEKTVLIPDFATGALIINNEEMFKKINETGLGTIRMRAKASIDNNIISITEIPFSTTREAIIDKIIDLVKLGKLKEVVDVKDLTGLNGMEIEITCKKNCDMKLLLEKLYQMTPMENTYSCNMNIICDGLPKVMGVWEIIDRWLVWRKECIKKGLVHEINNMNKKLHILKGMEKVLLDIDKAIEIIRFCPSNEMNNKLIEYFNIDDIQAEYIKNMKLKNINKDYILKQLQEVKELEDLICIKNEILNSDSKVYLLICDDLKNINNKYGQVRKTEIINFDVESRIAVAKLTKEVPDYKVKVIITRDGYIKKLNPTVKAEQKLKEGDEIVEEFETNNSNEIIVFSGTDAYKIRLDRINDSRPNMLGDYLPNILGISEIIGYSIIDDKYKFILIGYDNGKIAKIDLNSFKTETNRKKLSNSLYKGAKAYKIMTVEDDGDLIVVDINGREIVKSTTQLPLKSSRASQGSTLYRNIVDFRMR